MSSQYLKELCLRPVHHEQFDESMRLLDDQFKLPLLWGSPKLSSWYCVGLLARQGKGDIERANKLLVNCLSQQDLDQDFDRNYGSFKEFMTQPHASGPGALWAPQIYDSYDPNNALFFTLACIVIISDFSGLIRAPLLKDIKKAVHRCCQGNAVRAGGRYGDDMRPSYSNPFFMRCVCSAFVGNMMKDESLSSLADEWTREAVALWDEYNTPGEYNSPTYAGITMLAFGLAKYCPPSSAINKAAPKLLRSLWDDLGQVYNPSLLNIAGPWDRAYGFCMTQYFACIGPPISAISDTRCYPEPISAASHYDDIAIVPLQTLVSTYVESFLSDTTRDKLSHLTPHIHTASSFFPPFDKRPRKYTFALEQGLNVGGVDYDEEKLGGPKGELAQFVPGVIQWDAGLRSGGCGWITVWPTTSCASIVASPTSLAISLPPSSSFPATAITSKDIELHISALPLLQLDSKSFEGGRESLPGLDIELTGNIVDTGHKTLEFSQSTKRWDSWYYRLKYTFPDAVGADIVPELVISLRKVTPPDYPFEM